MLAALQLPATVALVAVAAAAAAAPPPPHALLSMPDGTTVAMPLINNGAWDLHTAGACLSGLLDIRNSC